MSKNIYVFEGNDQVGKSSIIEEVKNRFIQRGHQVFVHHAPGKGTFTLGGLVYKIHHHKDNIELENYDLDISPLVKQMLHVASHIDCEEKKILPEADAGQIIFMDRSWISTLAYGLAYGCNFDLLQRLVSIERVYLDVSDFRRIFMVYRSAELSDDRKKVDDSYDYVFSNLLHDANISKIHNDQPLERSVDEVEMIIMDDLQKW